MKKILSMVLCLCMIISCVPALTFATDPPAGGIGGMEEYLKYSTSLANDGYIGVPLDIYTYYGDETNDMTKVVMYIKNTNTERIGTDDDYTIVNDLVVNKKCIVVVVDYKNSSLAKGSDLDWSMQDLRTKVNTNGLYLAGANHRVGSTYLLPEGYNIIFDEYYWSIDKHGAVGSMEKIVEVWNEDFKASRPNVEITYPDGTTTLVKDTTAQSIYDCVNKDGSPLDMDLRLDVLYPTNPKKEVPVMALATSQHNRVNLWVNPKEPHLSGFLFGGYACVIFDYQYTPMARADHYSYFDGNTTGTSGDNYTYSLSCYGGIKSDTAAIRKIRLMIDEDERLKNLNPNKLGVMGLSKSGPCIRLANPDPESLEPTRFLGDYHGETRLEWEQKTGISDPYRTDERNVIKADGGKIVDDPEEQPWQTYADGRKIPSNVNFVFATVGGGQEAIDYGNAPVYSLGGLQEGGSYTGFYADVYNMCREHNVPMMGYVVPQMAHEFGHGADRDYGVESYDALFEFAGYWLRDDNAICKYITPLNGTDFVDTNTDITIKFTGSVSEDEIKKVSVVNNVTNEKASGSWKSLFGNTTWIFTPNELSGGDRYTVNVPQTIVADNGKPLASSKQISFKTKHEKGEISDGDTNKTLLKQGSTNNRAFYAFDSAELASSTTAAFRFNVSNDAANNVFVYALDEIDENNIENSSVGKLLGKINLTGSGAYDIDITDYAKSCLESGKKVGIMLESEKEKGKKVIKSLDFEAENIGSTAPANTNLIRYTIASVSDAQNATDGGSQSLKFEKVEPSNHNYKVGPYVGNNAGILSWQAKNSDLTADDIGRQFEFSMKIYDEDQRNIRLESRNAANATTIDEFAAKANYKTQPGQWIDASLNFRVEGETAVTIGKRNVHLITTTKEKPMYIDDVKILENITEVNISKAQMILHPADSLSLYPEEVCYVENGANKDSVMTNPDSAYVSGRSLSLDASVKAYIKLSLENYNANDPAGFTFMAKDGESGKVLVYGVSDKDEAANWSKDKINALNAPANGRFGEIDLTKVYLNSEIDEINVSGKGPYGIDLTDYATYMKNAGAQYITLIFVCGTDNKSLVLSENFDGSVQMTINRGGDPISTGKTYDEDHTGSANGMSYYMTAAHGYDRIRFDVLGYKNLTEADKGKKYRLTYWAKATAAGEFVNGLMPASGSVGTQTVTQTFKKANEWEKFSYDFTLGDDVFKDVSSPATGIISLVKFELKMSGLSAQNNITIYVDDFELYQTGMGNVSITPCDAVDKKVQIAKTDFNSNKEGNVSLINGREDVNEYPGSITGQGVNSKSVVKYSSEENYSGDSGLSVKFSPSTVNNRLKFFNVFDHVLTSEDVGRKMQISFYVKSDTAGSFSYGMISKVTRKLRDAGTIKFDIHEGYTADSADYGSNIYKPQTATISTSDIGKWKRFTYDITIDETMLPKMVDQYAKQADGTWEVSATHNAGIALLGIISTGFSDFTTQPILYIDDITTVETKENTEEETKTPFSYTQDFESVTNVSVIMGENGLEWQVLPGDTAKTKLDTYVLDSTEYYRGSKSLKLTSHYTYNKFKFKNTCDTFTEEDKGKEYQISFMAKASKSGSFGAGMSYSDGKYKNNFAQMVNFTVNPEDVGVWKRYVYKFTVGDEQLNDNAVWFSIIPDKMGQSGPQYHMGVAANGENEGWKYIDSLDTADPVYIYIDDFSSREIVPVTDTSLEVAESALVGANSENCSEIVISKGDETETSGIRKAYIHFAGGDYNYTQKATLFFDVTSGYEQTLKLYALKNADYPNGLTYSNAPGSNEDETMNTAKLYGAKAIAELKLNGAGTYSADVTNYVKDLAGNDYIFVLASEDVSGKEYLNLDFETIKLTKDTDYKGYGAFNKAIDTSSGAAKVDAENPGDGIIILNAFGSGKTISAGEKYKVSADVKNLSDADKRFTVALADSSASYIAGENTVNIPSGQSANVQFEITAGAEAVQNGVCAAVIYSADGGAFEVDNVKIVSESAVEIDKNSVRLDVETAKENPQPVENTVSVTLSTTGDSITVDSENVGASSVKDYAVGRTLALSANGEGTFMYWKDADSGLIVSYNKDYEFTVGSARKLIAIFAENGGAYVTFKNINGFVLAEGLASSLTVPKDPYVYGYEFAGWYVGNNEKTSLKAGDRIDVSENTVYFAGFGKKETAYKITVNGEEKTYSYNDKVTVVADAEKDGKTFSYWKKDGKAASYDKEYSFYATADSVLEAVYGENAESKNVLVMANPVMADETRIAFFAERNISSDCEIIETGILMGKAEGLTLESASIKAVAKSKAQNGQYTVRKKGVVSGETWYAKAYVIYRDSTGSAQTIYSNEVSMTVK